jgi:hypothetical protein
MQMMDYVKQIIDLQHEALREGDIIEFVDAVLVSATILKSQYQRLEPQIEIPRNRLN